VCVCVCGGGGVVCGGVGGGWGGGGGGGGGGRDALLMCIECECCVYWVVSLILYVNSQKKIIHEPLQGPLVNRTETLHSK